MMEMAFPYLAILAFSLSLLAVALNHATASWRNDLNAVQSMHLRSTSRFGGLAVFLACAISVSASLTDSHSQVIQIFFFAFPVILVGLCEDAGWRVAPYLRLMAGAVSSFLAIEVSGAVIEHLGFLPLDVALKYQAISVAFTVFALTGTTQAFNLLDGLHGLCGFTSVLIALGLALISIKGGQEGFGYALIPVAVALLGFLALNFPRGLIFLGDAGATGVGFILACSAVQMLKLLPDLSPFALALVFFWPIADTLLTIARRVGLKKTTMHPDRMHFHHVVMRAFEIKVLRKRNRAVSNPAATMIMMPFIAMPTILGVVLWNQNYLAFTATFLFAALFVTTFRTLVLCAKRNWKIGSFVGRAVSREVDVRSEYGG